MGPFLERSIPAVAAVPIVAGAAMGGDFGHGLACLTGAAAVAAACGGTSRRRTNVVRAGWALLSLGVLCQGVAAVAGAPESIVAGVGLAGASAFYLFVSPYPALALLRRFAEILLCLLGLFVLSVAPETPLAGGLPAGALAGAVGLSLGLGLELMRRADADRSRARSARWLAVAFAAQGAFALAASPAGEAAPHFSPLMFLSWGAIGLAAWYAPKRPLTPPPTPPGASAVGPALAVVGAAALWIPSAADALAVGGLAGAVVAAAPLLSISLMILRHAASDYGNQRQLDQLDEETSRLRTMIDYVGEAVYVENLREEPIFYNQRYLRILCLTAEQVPSTPLDSLLSASDRLKLRQQIRSCRDDYLSANVAEYDVVRMDGSVVPVECSVAGVRVGGLLIGVQAVLRDISRQRLIETSQRAMAQRLEFFFSELPLACIIWDLDFTVQEWNASAERIFGWTASEALAMSYGDFLAERPDDRIEKAWDALRQGKATANHSCRNRTKSGAVIDCEWFQTSLIDENGEVVAVASMVQDVTERLGLEQQLLQSQKMEALGALAGGVAHDFNNLLTVIHGNTMLARMRLGPGSAADQDLGAVAKAAERATELVQQLLRFSRRTPTERRRIVLNERLTEAAQLLRHSVRSSVDVEMDLDPGLWEAEADEAQIGQAVMNLGVNARDAVGGQGRIVVRSRNAVLDDEFCRTRPWARLGLWVKFEVEDNGCGMDDKTRQRVFEPFFTTKPVGKGTGLGLATVYGIVKNHGGGVEVESAVGQGSKFTIFLPAAHSESMAAAGGESRQPLSYASRVVLIADADAEERRRAAAGLQMKGHVVLEASDAATVNEIYANDHGRIDVVLLDLGLPGASAAGLLRSLQAIDDRPTFLFASSNRSGALAAGVSLLAKPYRLEQLLEAIGSAPAAELADR